MKISGDSSEELIRCLNHYASYDGFFALDLYLDVIAGLPPL